jgi:hypothetical protein
VLFVITGTRIAEIRILAIQSYSQSHIHFVNKLGLQIVPGFNRIEQIRIYFTANFLVRLRTIFTCKLLVRVRTMLGARKSGEAIASPPVVLFGKYARD